MSQAAVFITCQTPLKSGLPSGVRGIAFAGVCARAAETVAVKRRTSEVSVAAAGRRYGMQPSYTPGAHVVASAGCCADGLDRCLGRGSRTADRLCKTRIDLPRIQFKDFLLVTRIERRVLVDVAL